MSASMTSPSTTAPSTTNMSATGTGVDSTGTGPTGTTVALDSSGSGSSSDSDSSSDSGSSSGSTGPGLGPEIEVSIEMAAVATGDSYDFASTVDVGMVGTPVTVTIENVGVEDLNLAGVSISAGDADHFTIDTGALDAVVMPTDSTTFTIAFSPVNGGLKAGTLSIDNNDADEAPFEIMLGAHTTENTYRDLAPVVAPTGRFNAAMTDLQDGRLLMFGGRNAAGIRLNDTWIFDLEAETWTELMPMAPPSLRDAHKMVYAGGDAVILFGGNTQVGGGEGAGAIPQQETWSFDLVTEQWTLLAPVGTPPPRFQHMMVATGPDTILLFGGQDGNFSHLGDTWTYDAVANTWTNLAPVGAPAARSGAAIGFDGTNTVTLFGGVEPFVALDQTWNYDIAANTWAAGVPATTPGTRMTICGAYYAGGSFIVYSGKPTITNDPTQATFAYSPALDDWTNLLPLTEPAPRFSYAMAYVEGANKSIIFGGNLLNAGPGGAVGETWEYVGPQP